MAISRSLMNRQLRADGGIMQVAPREKFGIGSKLKKRLRKLIPNELANIATKAAPFVAPFNPLLAAGMSGIGSFDQTGKIGDSLKKGALTYGLGQGARYLGGADFQGLQNPFAKDAFSMPTGSGGIKNLFKSDVKPIQPISGGEFGQFPEPTFGAGDTIGGEMATGAGEIITGTTSTTSGSAMDSLKTLGSFKTSAADKGQAALDLLKRGSKALFYKEGKLDKNAVLGAVTAAGTYIEALMLAKDAGLDLTEEEYDEARRDEKKQEYGDYLQDFFGGKKDGGRIGFESGANEMIKTQLLEEIMPDTSTEDMIMIMTEDGPKMIKRSDFEAMSGMFRDTTTSAYGDAGRGRPVPEFANGGRIGFKDGTDDDAFEELDNIRELVHTLMKEEDISESEAYEKVIKKLYAKGGRVSRKFGSPKEGESEVGIMAIDVESGDEEDEEDMMMAGGITFSRAEKSYLFRRLGGGGGSDRSYTMPSLYRILNNPNRYPEDARILKSIVEINLPGGQKDGGRIGLKGGGTDKMEQYKKYVSDMIKDGETPVDFEEFLKMTNYKDGGRIGYKGGANRVSELLILRDELIGKGEDVSDIEAEIFQLTGKTFRSVGGISDIPTGKMRKNNAGVVERDYRDEGGFVPVGIKERADDVPAMLSKNEFVMTADAVRGIGNGSVEEGSKKLYNTMKKAEQVGKA